MPQWSRDCSEIASRYPDERRTALCPAAIARELLPFDHHVVWLSGRAAVLLTYHWHEIDLEVAIPPFRCAASFTFADGHPAAPPRINALAQSLDWHPDASRTSAS